MTAAPDEPASGRGARLHALTDRIPTGWFAGIFTAAFLALTAGFGGLAAVAVPPVPELAPGETHTSEQFALSVDRAVLIDELPGSGVTPEFGERVLAVVVTVENTWTRPQPAAASDSLVDVVRLPSRDDAVPAIARLDDATGNPYLQPRVPAELVLSWLVDSEELADGDELRVELRDHSLSTGKLITYGDTWGSPVTSAYVDIAIEDVGAGATGDDGADG